MTTIVQIAFKLFFIINPIGNTPAVLALVKDFDFARQRYIMLREATFALILAIVFQFIGESILDALGIAGYSLRVTGGFLLAFVGLSLVFPKREVESASTTITREPYFVPIATPLLAGPGLLTYIMVNSKLVNDSFAMVGSILLAFVGVFAILFCAPYLLRKFGRRGMIILEQLMGMILIMFGTELMISGMALFLHMIKSV